MCLNPFRPTKRRRRRSSRRQYRRLQRRRQRRLIRINIRFLLFIRRVLELELLQQQRDSTVPYHIRVLADLPPLLLGEAADAAAATAVTTSGEAASALASTLPHPPP